jgi:hypothetical protein
MFLREQHLPHQITLTEAREGIGTDPILFTPTSAKDMIEIHAPELPPDITDFQVLSGIGADAVLVSPGAVYKFTKTLGVKCSSARISPADSPRA